MIVFTTAVSIVLIVSFLCSIFESVLLSINHAQIEALAAKHRGAGRLLAGFKREIDIPIAAILIVNTAAHTIGATVAGASYQQVFSSETLWLFTIVFTLAVLLLTEIVPKTLGVTFTRTLARPVAHGIFVLTASLRPLVRLSGLISRALRGNRKIPVTSIEEIRLLTALGRSEGVVGVQTAEMIVGASRLRQLTASDVIVPRTQVTFLSAKQSRDSVLETLRQSGFSRFPFTHTDELDQVSGTVFVRELLFWLQANPGQEIDWTGLVHEPLIIPEQKRLNSLLWTFKQENKHQALVIDEYGDLQGIVTLEDVLEEIVGEIGDESDPVIEDFWPQRDGSLYVRATLDLRRLCNQLKIEWSADTEATTLGGLLTDHLGRVPVKDDTIEWRGYSLKVLAASERRAELIAIKREDCDSQ
ncbi:MAG: hemolysin family protein [Gammaproteobacteria bacterium]|nr:hemolysin family protein [Gammaproteobacteria bacterium]MDH3768201.1 hemolysin family protein [Gammaproteobacteria bacterium]